MPEQIPEKEAVVAYKPIIYLTPDDDNAQNFPDLFNIFSEQIKLADISTETPSSQEKVLIDPSKRALYTAILSIAIYSLPGFPLTLGFLEIIGLIFSSVGWDTFSTKSLDNWKNWVSTKDSKTSNDNSTNLKFLLEKSIQIVPSSSVLEKLNFPPDHPIPNKFYRQHPLPNKKNYYIPAESYYITLQEEKESELIRILCDLGATKIEIYEEENTLNDIELKGKAKLKNMGGIEASTSKETEKSQLSKDESTFKGQPWHPKLKDEFDSSQYSWLHYEPRWEAIVYGRLTNCQLMANIELTTNLSKEGMIGISLFEGILKGIGVFDTSASVSNSMIKKRRFFIEFAGEEESKSAKGKK
ncbi:MAG: hypothetical protein ACRCU2_11240 [Planktothrix sp.]